jgi:hypothetical protein
LTITGQGLPAIYVIHPDAMPPGSALFLAFMAYVPPNDATSDVAAVKPVVLNDDTAPACVPVADK